MYIWTYTSAWHYLRLVRAPPARWSGATIYLSGSSLMCFLSMPVVFAGRFGLRVASRQQCLGRHLEEMGKNEVLQRAWVWEVDFLLPCKFLDICVGRFATCNGEPCFIRVGGIEPALLKNKWFILHEVVGGRLAERVIFQRPFCRKVLFVLLHNLNMAQN